MLFGIPAIGLDAKGNDRAKSAPEKAGTESLLVKKRIPYQSGNRRDPFLNPLLLKKRTNKVEADEEVPRGVPPPGIAGTYIAQAVLQGISVRGEQKLAVFRSYDDRAYFLSEGDRLFDGYVKMIGKDFVVLVSETKLKSGKTLTRDITKRLRTP